MRPVVLLALVLGPVLPACGGNPVAKIHPSIGLFDDKSGALSELDFGAVSVGKPKAATFSIHSLQQVPLTISAIDFEDDDDGKSGKAYSVQIPDAFPMTIPPGGQAPASIALTPDDVRAFPARMVVHSDDPGHPTVKVKLTGLGIAGALDLSACVAGTDACKGSTVEAPGPLQMDKVTVGDHEDVFVVLRNTGKDTLSVTSVDFADPAGAMAAGFTLSKGAGTASVPPGSSRSVTVTYAPTKEASKVAASVVATTNDRDHPTLSIGLSVDAVPNGIPLACAYVKSILHFRTGQTETLTPDEAVPVVEPLDTVTLSPAVRAGCSGDPEDGTVITYAWTVAGPQVAKASDPELVLRPERSGLYTISLAVKDHLGVEGTTDDGGKPAVVTLDVHPTTDIAAEVSWGADASPDETPGNDIDLDLHFLRNTLVAPFGNDDCRRPISESDSSCGLRWGDPTLTTDDPHHSPDDSGFGDLVETASLDSPESKPYYLAVEYFNDRRQLTGAPTCTDDTGCTGDAPDCIDGTCRASVWVQGRAFIKGVDAGEIGPIRLDHPCDVWIAGYVDWTQKPPALVKVNTVEPAEKNGNIWGTPQGASCLAPVQ